MPDATYSPVSPAPSHEDSRRPSPEPHPEPHPAPTEEPAEEPAEDPSKETETPEGNVKPSLWKFISDLFIWEILAMFISSGLLIAIIVILDKYNNQPQPTWKYVSLNSVVSWLSTLSKGCVLFTLSEGIGQLKWVWFTQKTQPLVDLGTFDGASRGIWGCAGLVWRLRAKHFAALGSLAVILGLAFDPFIQNLIHYYPKLIIDPSGTADVSSNSIYSAMGPPLGIGDFYLHAEMKANIYNALFNSDESKPWSIPRYTCSSGNCTWDPIATLEMQASCTNITDKLKFEIYNGTNGSRNPNTTEQSQSITLQSGTKNLTADVVVKSVWGTPVALGSISPIIYNDTIIPPIQLIAPDGLLGNAIWGSSKDGELMHLTWQAIECSISPIVRSIRPRVSRGKYYEDVLDTWKNGTFESYPLGSPYNLKPNWGPDKGLKKGKSFTIAKQSLTSIRYFFTNFFSGRMALTPFDLSFVSDTSTSTGMGSQMTSTSNYASGDLMQLMTVSNITDCNLSTAEKLRCAMEHVAQAMTKAIRDQSSSLPANLTCSSGDAMMSATHIAIHWQWIVLPALVWLLGLVTLVGTMWKTRRAMIPAWKNETMPIIDLCRNSQNEKPQTDEGLPTERARLYESDGRMVMCG
ncbi:unnamed protein product [Penicillium olsonii]|nr:unnamed protein product [Penicillium olsonii]